MLSLNVTFAFKPLLLALALPLLFPFALLKGAFFFKGPKEETQGKRQKAPLLPFPLLLAMMAQKGPKGKSSIVFTKSTIEYAD
jgi:hypothetical protein